jgi:hypothetical protein
MFFYSKTQTDRNCLPPNGNFLRHKILCCHRKQTPILPNKQGDKSQLYMDRIRGSQLLELVNRLRVEHAEFLFRIQTTWLKNYQNYFNRDRVKHS